MAVEARHRQNETKRVEKKKKKMKRSNGRSICRLLHTIFIPELFAIIPIGGPNCGSERPKTYEPYTHLTMYDTDRVAPLECTRVCRVQFGYIARSAGLRSITAMLHCICYFVRCLSHTASLVYKYKKIYLINLVYYCLKSDKEPWSEE